MKVYIRTFGCQMNERDSEFIAGLFMEKGYELIDSPEEADIVLFNTCSVREHAEERAISNMGHLMKQYKNKIYGMVGCAAQALKGKLFERLPKLGLVCGTGEIAKLPELVEKIVDSSGGLNLRYLEEARKSKILACENIDGDIPELRSRYRENNKRAYVSIMRGCDNFCSYCIVPYVRGRERSRKIEYILNEIKGLGKRGIKDITLLGQNVNSYRPDFVNLLGEINKIQGVEKINFLTSHPKDANIELFKAIQDSDKIIKHLHLPLQSGSDRILKLMNRGYTREKYLNLIGEARNIIQGLHLTTDIIVGFPTETEEDFNDTLNLMKDTKFGMAYIFKYSPRTGTEAAKLADDVPADVKGKRHKILLDLQREIHKRKIYEKTRCHCVN
ncbi:MAG: tRNA (N6-isopentenyl adenosine(37)-C2)-methylthiotransferase MiaB [Candidatus Omnitrophota bacterium]|nr:MAG: tRNA (N6-isopentenyl adenosine(37)-C2)-methylthiotransferase MiaB [Candidatus Omnitrophota bacterium]